MYSPLSTYRKWDKHGRKSPEYMAWCDMRKRCLNPNFKKYARYGGRGIKICDRWIDSFENFLADMGLRPKSRRCTLERKDNDGDYTPDNCVWATYLKQNSNYSFNHLVTINDRTLHVAAWCRVYGITTMCYYARKQKGLSDIDAIITPRRHNGPKKLPLTTSQIENIKAERGQYTQAHTARRHGVSQSTVHNVQVGKW